ncbi:siderophore-interacting protein [Streptomyces alboflavus]|uniref:siderophore-interacting protein n=1 Tax=Streptomyces alboflavus TaxID=67267 RepID=UPI001F3A1E55|nr:SIP domain-containing protein [Streptomyces alboflavus]
MDRRKLGKGKLPTRAEAQVVWLSRDGAPAGTTDLLERAVRDMEWLPGTAYAWVAGETVTLKGIRRHLVTERQVAREHTHITGYWRRTTPAPAAPGDADAHGQVAADHSEAEADDAHERLHRLTDPAPGHAIRAAVTLACSSWWTAARGTPPASPSAPGPTPSRSRRCSPTSSPSTSSPSTATAIGSPPSARSWSRTATPPTSTTSAAPRPRSTPR